MKLFSVFMLVFALGLWGCDQDGSQQQSHIDYQIDIYAGGELKVNNATMTIEQLDAALEKNAAQKPLKVQVQPAHDVRLAELRKVQDLLRKHHITSVSYSSGL